MVPNLASTETSIMIRFFPGYWQGKKQSEREDSAPAWFTFDCKGC